jgi:hypothetical protein
MNPANSFYAEFDAKYRVQTLQAEANNRRLGSDAPKRSQHENRLLAIVRSLFGLNAPVNAPVNASAPKGYKRA